MNLAAFASLLNDAIGLDVASIGVSAVERAVDARARVCDAGDEEAYLDRLRTSPGELAELIDAVIVPETWFFRERGAFVALRRIAREEWTNGRRRILSLPCATGEEAYSIAIALIEAGFPRDRLGIDAIDVSPRLIARAAAATYGKNSFRGANLAFRDAHFRRETDGYRLSQAVRRLVHFRVDNLLNPDSVGDAEPYDAVFCRNLLVYFDVGTQRQALATLARLVRDGGLLFVGPSEANLIGGRDFERVKAPMAFAFRRRFAAAATPLPVKSASRRHHGPRPARPPDTPPPVGGAVAPTAGLPLRPAGSATASPQPASGGGSGLGEIERLANAGRFAEAARLCDAHLGKAGASADTLVLLALIRDAAGNAGEAIELYRKALYLEPDHEMALVHLKLRLEQNGDAAGAERLNQRMRRIAERRAR